MLQIGVNGMSSQLQLGSHACNVPLIKWKLFESHPMNEYENVAHSAIVLIKMFHMYRALGGGLYFVITNPEMRNPQTTP